jgi:hypothetical protein
MNTKIANTARIRRTTVLAAGMWVVFALALAFTTMSLYPRAWHRRGGGTKRRLSRGGFGRRAARGRDLRAHRTVFRLPESGRGRD